MLRRAAAGPRRVWRRTAAAAAPADSSGVWREGNAAGWSLGRAGVGAGVPPRRRGVGGVAAVQVSVLVAPRSFRVTEEVFPFPAAAARPRRAAGGSGGHDRNPFSLTSPLRGSVLARSGAVACACPCSSRLEIIGRPPVPDRPSGA